MPWYGVSRIFRVLPEDLILFFEKRNLKMPDNQGESRIALNILKDCGYNEGLTQLLVTDKESGIAGDSKDIERRQQIFGKNKIALPSITPFHELLATQFEDDNVIFLILSATAYLGFSLFSNSDTAYMESLTIYMGVFFASFISAFCAWIKERQFLKIKDEINNAKVLVYRGAFGSVCSISVRDLVVGDVIDIQAGERVPADCILIEETNITVNQSMYDASQTKIEKETSKNYYANPETWNLGEELDNHKECPDPFLLSNSMILTGCGKAVVCCVGDNTLLARTRNKEDLVIN